MNNVVTMRRVGKYGRFGNQVAQIMGILGVATKCGHRFAFTYWRNYDALERFGTKEDIDVQKYFLHPLPLLPESGIDFFEIGYPFGYQEINLPTIGNFDLTGHFQSEKFFAHCIDLCRYYMTMKDEGLQTDYVAVHFRGGDYSGHNAGYHPRMTMEYYEKAMCQFDSDTRFLVFSDEMDTAKQMFGRYKNMEYAEGNTYLEDFRLMKRCKSFIIANSSFSWCAAVLGDAVEKKVVAPSVWFGPLFGSDYRTKSKDVYGKDWVVI